MEKEGGQGIDSNNITTTNAAVVTETDLYTKLDSATISDPNNNITSEIIPDAMPNNVCTGVDITLHDMSSAPIPTELDADTASGGTQTDMGTAVWCGA